MRRRPVKGHARRTEHFWPERLKVAKGFFVDMFLEDVRLWVVPSGGRAYRRDNFRVRCDPDDKETVARVRLALGAAPYRDLTEQTCEFIADSAQYLATFGEEFFEIVDVGAQQIEIISLPPRSVRELGPLMVQVLPQTVARRLGRRLVFLDRSHVWHLGLPLELRSRRANERMLRSLQVRATYPQWSLSATRAGRTTEIDRDLFVKLVDERVLARTRVWGWPARDTGAAHMTIYHRIRRELTFARAMAVLREHILRELNALFARRNIGATLSFVDLPSRESCQAALQDLERGAKPFTEILPSVRW